MLTAELPPTSPRVILAVAHGTLAGCTNIGWKKWDLVPPDARALEVRVQDDALPVPALQGKEAFQSSLSWAKLAASRISH